MEGRMWWWRGFWMIKLGSTYEFFQGVLEGLGYWEGRGRVLGFENEVIIPEFFQGVLG
jgi:hypothetical protein